MKIGIDPKTSLVTGARPTGPRAKAIQHGSRPVTLKNSTNAIPISTIQKKPWHNCRLPETYSRRTTTALTKETLMRVATGALVFLLAALPALASTPHLQPGDRLRGPSPEITKDEHNRITKVRSAAG